MTDSDLLNTTQAAKILGVKPETLAVWRVTGRYNLAYVKVGRLVKYRKTALKNFINNNTKLGHSHAGGPQS